jgi:3-oxoacyl-[acyl-carrier protein] reductase
MPDRRPVAIVTGGTRGIGLGIASALARDGWDLALSGVRPPSAIEGLVTDLRAQGGRVEYVASDIAIAADRARFLSDVIRKLGVPSALVNNAGRAPSVRADLLDATEESFEQLLRTNLQGPYFLTQAVAREMLTAGLPAVVRQVNAGRAKVGGIVFITSVSAEMASPNRGEYCVSKAGLAMAAKLFAVHLAPQGIPVYEVRPGIITTDMTAGVKEKYDQRIADGLIPEGRWGTPEDVGRAVAALLRGDLSHATGSVIHVDGGLAVPRL